MRLVANAVGGRAPVRIMRAVARARRHSVRGSGTSAVGTGAAPSVSCNRRARRRQSGRLQFPGGARRGLGSGWFASRALGSVAGVGSVPMSAWIGSRRSRGFGSERQAMSPSQEGETRAAYVIQRTSGAYARAMTRPRLTVISSWSASGFVPVAPPRRPARFASSRRPVSARRPTGRCRRSDLSRAAAWRRRRLWKVLDCEPRLTETRPGAFFGKPR